MSPRKAPNKRAAPPSDSESDLSSSQDASFSSATAAKKKAKTNCVEGGKKPGKAKAKEPVKPLDAALPTNRVMPTNLDFLAKSERSIRISAWNVCGLNTCEKKGLKVYLDAEDADIVILTETKMQKEPELMHIKTRYKYRYWGADPQKGYAGVAVLSKHRPLKVSYGLPTWTPDPKITEGRLVMLDFETLYLIGCYTPNAGEKLKNLDYKNKWNKAFCEYLKQLNAVKPVIWGGDINCAPTEKDIRNAKTNWNKTAGYTEAECEAFAKQLDEGKMVDAWRVPRPEQVGHYTYYSYKFQCREKGIGWRLDTFVVSEQLYKERVVSCEIRHECYGASDHLPVVMDIRGEL